MTEAKLKKIEQRIIYETPISPSYGDHLYIEDACRYVEQLIAEVRRLNKIIKKDL